MRACVLSAKEPVQNLIPRRNQKKAYFFDSETESDRRMFCINVDRRILSGSADSLRCYRTSEAKVEGCRQSSRNTLKILMTIQHLVRNAWLSDGVEYNSSAVMFFEGGDMRNSEYRVDEFVETIKTTSGKVVGWRFWFYVADKTFKFSKALENLMTANAIRLAKPRAHKETYVDEMDKYVKTLVDNGEQWAPIVRLAMGFGDADWKRSKAISVTDEANPARIENFCLFDNVFAAWTPKTGRFSFSEDVRPSYVSKRSYVSEEDPELQFFRFPHGALPVRDLEKDDRFVMNLKLIEVEGVTRLWQAGLTDAEVAEGMHNIAAAVIEGKIDPSLVASDVVEDIRRANVEARESLRREKEEGADDEEIDRVPFEETHEFQSRLRTFFSDETPFRPGVRPCYEWIEEKKSSEATFGRKWSAVRAAHRSLDEELTPFASYVARDAFVLESAFGMLNFHKEMVYTLIWRLGVFHPDRDKLMCHHVLSGPPSAGKSFLTKLLCKLSVPKTIRSVGRSTEMAYCTGVNYDCLILYHDELPKSFFVYDDKSGGSKTGNEILKSLLTENEFTTETVQFKENGDRETVQYHAKMQCMIIGLTNEPKSSFPEAMESRLFVTTVSRWDRDGIDTSTAIKRANEALNNLKPGIIEEYQIVQATAAILQEQIRAAFLENDVDESVGQSVVQQVKRFLKTRGIFVGDSRVWERVEFFMRCCAIYEAVRTTFFTTSVLEENEEFDYSQILKMKGLLRITDEHAYFALTSMSHCFVDENVDVVVRAMAEIARKAKNPFLATLDGQNVDVDRDFYFVSGGGVIDSSKVVDNVVDRILTHVRKTRHRHLSKDAVVCTLNWLFKQSISSATYDDNGKSSSTTTREVRVAERRWKKLQGNDAGIVLSRAFVDVVEESGDSLMVEAIKSTFDAHTPEKKIVLGTTYREGFPGVNDNRSFPHLFRVMTTRSVPNKIVNIRNPDYSDEGYGSCITGKEFDPVPSFLSYREADVNETHLRDFLRKRELVGTTYENLCRRTRTPNGLKNKDYPKYYAKVHEKSFDVVESEKKKEDDVVVKRPRLSDEDDECDDDDEFEELR